jgi:hypothetical protein
MTDTATSTIKWRYRPFEEDRSAHAFTLSDWKFLSLCKQHNFMNGTWVVAGEGIERCLACRVAAAVKGDADGGKEKEAQDADSDSEKKATQASDAERADTDGGEKAGRGGKQER